MKRKLKRTAVAIHHSRHAMFVTNDGRAKCKIACTGKVYDASVESTITGQIYNTDSGLWFSFYHDKVTCKKCLLKTLKFKLSLA